ncbi:MAG: flavodoxin family protein [Dysgonamonadaceae bacterium]|nr:flavodoxin family protein [Dysgonamonadaceae bacterium]
MSKEKEFDNKTSSGRKISRRNAIKYAGVTAGGALVTYLGMKYYTGQNDSTATMPLANEADANLITYQNKTNMKVLLLNGSPHKKGCTYTALSEVGVALEQNGIESKLSWLGMESISGCRGCGSCRSTGKCIIEDNVNVLLEKVNTYDGFVFGSPVHYAGASGFITPFLDRLFYAGGSRFAGKPGAAIVSCRRAGSTAALEQLNKYITISNMPLVSSQYWNMVHGNTPDEVRRDLEGMQTMRALGQNMAWIVKCIAAGKAAGIEPPTYEQRTATNFIR